VDLRFPGSVTVRRRFEIKFIELGDRLLWGTAWTETSSTTQRGPIYAWPSYSRRAVPFHLD
jgi:hypothetical protein